MPELIPIRFGRTQVGPFPLLLGSAALMAEDLASTLTSGIRLKARGDCHLLTFGLFVSQTLGSDQPSIIMAFAEPLSPP